jgi:hypothetical protein
MECHKVNNNVYKLQLTFELTLRFSTYVTGYIRNRIMLIIPTEYASSGVLRHLSISELAV